MKSPTHHAYSGEDQTAETDDSTRIDREGFKRSHKRLSTREIHRALRVSDVREGESYECWSRRANELAEHSTKVA